MVNTECHKDLLSIYWWSQGHFSALTYRQYVENIVDFK